MPGGPNPGALQRALAELHADPYRSDRAIAAEARCEHRTVARARLADPAFSPPPAARAARPVPLRSAVHELVAAGLPTREITAQLGITRSAVWKARHQIVTRHRGDAAGAADELQVTRVTGLASAAAAADEFHVRLITESQQSVSRREADRRRAATAASRYPVPWKTTGYQEPRIDELPRPPDWAAASCAGHQHPDWWTSREQPEREAARKVCSGCPVLAGCLAWSLHLPATDTAVYAGLDHLDRRRLKRESQG